MFVCIWTLCKDPTHVNTTLPHITHTLSSSLKLYEIQKISSKSYFKIKATRKEYSWAVTLSYWSKEAWLLRRGHFHEIVFDASLYVWVQVFNLLPERRIPQPQHGNLRQEYKEERPHHEPGATQHLNKEGRNVQYYICLISCCSNLHAGKHSPCCWCWFGVTAAKMKQNVNVVQKVLNSS